NGGADAVAPAHAGGDERLLRGGEAHPLHGGDAGRDPPRDRPLGFRPLPALPPAGPRLRLLVDQSAQDGRGGGHRSGEGWLRGGRGVPGGILEAPGGLDARRAGRRALPARRGFVPLRHAPLSATARGSEPDLRLAPELSDLVDVGAAGVLERSGAGRGKRDEDRGKDLAPPSSAGGGAA